MKVRMICGKCHEKSKAVKLDMVSFKAGMITGHWKYKCPYCQAITPILEDSDIEEEAE